MNMDKGNSYGLIIPKKDQLVKPTAQIPKSVFNEESDSDDHRVSGSMTGGLGNNQRRMVRKIQERALEEDPTIFQYDEIYGEIELQRQAEKREEHHDIKKPKYINRLLHFANQRSIENERRLERAIQKERELEGGQFGSKDCFVTSSYRKKLEEFKKAEERERREDYLESIGDVTKQENLDGFYRHLYEQTLGSDNLVGNSETPIMQIDCSGKKHGRKKSVNLKGKSSSRVYRKRNISGDETDDQYCREEFSTKKSHLHCNLDADSDFSIDSSSEDTVEESISQGLSEQLNNDTKQFLKEEPGLPTYPLTSVEDNVPECTLHDNPNNKKNKDLWEKRTIGTVLQEALKRYYQRKASKLL